MRLIIGWLLGLAGNAVGLILAALILPDDMFSIELFSLSFFWAVLIFAVVSALFTFIIFKFLMRNAGSIVALTGLISTFLALLITSLISDGLSISGMGWVCGHADRLDLRHVHLADPLVPGGRTARKVAASAGVTGGQYRTQRSDV